MAMAHKDVLSSKQDVLRWNIYAHAAALLIVGELQKKTTDVQQLDSQLKRALNLAGQIAWKADELK